MANVINLTLPLYPYMPVGNVWAYDVPFQVEPIREWEYGGAQLEYYQFNSETGTRLMSRARYDPEAPRIGDVNFADLVDRETIIIDIPKGSNQEITAEEIDNLVVRDTEYKEGQALLIRTGWGDGERYRKLGDDYVLKTPCFSSDGATRLAEVMRDKGSNLLAVDTAYLAGCGRTYMIREWVSIVPWQRPHWPAEEAKIYLRYYTPDKERADWGSARPLYDAGLVLAALCNTCAIKTKHVHDKGGYDVMI